MEKAKVLIIDDLKENLFVLEEILMQEDREIISAMSGNEALKLARKHDFAIILSDVQMPEMDGFELLSILRSHVRTKDIPVIFLTAINKEDSYVHMGYSEGAIDYIFKPLDPTIVSSKVDTFITLYHQRKQLEEQNQKLGELGQQKNKFLGMAAHDIRNPLSVIQHYTHSLLDKSLTDLDPVDFKMSLETIYSSAIFIQNLADELLDFTKIEATDFIPKLKYTEIHTFLTSVVRINHLFGNKKDIEILADFELPNLSMEIDPSKITQVLNNLLSNAIKFSEPGTEIRLKAYIEKGQLIIIVKDQGQGIPQREIEKLFTPFTTLSVKSTAGEKSTGLGLTIVKKIIEGHEGTIHVESTVGEGTSFIIQLPIGEYEEEEANFCNINENTRILLLEDNIVMQTLMKAVLESEGLQVAVAENGSEALEKLKGYTPDIIFSDVNMPVMDGYEFGHRLMELGVDIPIVGLTAMINDEVQELSSQAGFSEIKEKPISKIALYQIMSKYISKSA